MAAPSINCPACGETLPLRVTTRTATVRDATPGAASRFYFEVDASEALAHLKTHGTDGGPDGDGEPIPVPHAA